MQKKWFSGLPVIRTIRGGIWLSGAFLISIFTGVNAAESVTQNGITWHFDRDYPTGEFVNGDYWVKGPVKIVRITNNLHTGKFTPRPGQDGSTVNPSSSSKGGYDSTAKRQYDEKLNAAMPGGKPLSPDNPLVLNPDQSLVSTVSFLWNTPEDKEADSPRFAAHNGTLVGVTRAAAVLTCVDKTPPPGTFRPGYCGKVKKYRNISDVNWDLLNKFEPPAEIFYADVPTPGPKIRSPLHGKVNINQLIDGTSRVWLDHLSGWPGSVNAPYNNKPLYGRDMCSMLSSAMLALHLDWSKIPGKPSEDLRRKLAVNLMQIGIDLASAASIGCNWGADGGICAGRKPAILFAGLLLNDPEMKNIGNWKNRFQDNENTFYVTQKEIDLTNSSKWKPDKRAGLLLPYTADMLGMPEWGIRHVEVPQCDNAAWCATYREINNVYIPSFALAMMMTGGRKAFAHEAYFDYADRVMRHERNYLKYANTPTAFTISMWQKYRKNYPSTYNTKFDKFIFLPEKK